jgi:hypothetical protein
MPLESDYGTYKIDDAGMKALIPSRVDGQQLTKQEALDKYKTTNRALGKFNSDAEIEEFIRKMKQQRNIYGG